MADIQLLNMDCMEYMAGCKDKAFELAIVDPPYGIGENGSSNKTRGKLAIAKDYKPFYGMDVDAPQTEYFKQLMRIAKNQVIFGANHFIHRMPYPSPCWIVWDKKNGNSDFADSELAWTSFKTAVRNFSFQWAGMLQENMKNKEIRIHPTQKPVALYKWILKTYAKPGDRIFDSHGGSFSSAIACQQMGFDFVGCELDKDYYDAAVARFHKQTRQTEMFDYQPLQPASQQLTMTL
jgi:site-specific DNA-methyltransferase (adenine-specific)